MPRQSKLTAPSQEPSSLSDDNPTDPKDFRYCSFCNRAGATHEGGAKTPAGEIRGFFCNESCFEKWKKIYPALFVWKKSKESPQAPYLINQ
jgi:hypothetical protein